MKAFHVLSGVAAGLLLAGQVSAVTFDLTGPTQVVNQLSLSNDGVAVTLTGWDATLSQRKLHIDGDGVGVQKDASENPQIDGGGLFEGLVLEFNQIVTLDKATFTKVGKDDAFSLFVDLIPVVIADIPGGNDADTGISLVDFSKDFKVGNAALTGKFFLFSVKDASDDYKLASVNVKDKGAAAVPEPVTATLGGLSIVGLTLAVLRRRR